MNTTPRLVLGATTAAMVLTALCGCALGATSNSPTAAGSGATPKHAGASSAASDSSVSHQRPLTAVPAACPIPDAISLSMHHSLPSLYTPSPEPGSLECEYYNTADTSNALVIFFDPAKGLTVAQFRQKVLGALPSATSVAGVGDAAYYAVTTLSDGKTVGEMYFLSGAVAGYVYAGADIATQANLAALVGDQILVP